MATEHNQNTKSMNSLESNESNIIGNDTDRKLSSENTKCEITTDEHQNEIQINYEISDHMATEHNQNTKSMNCIVSNESNAIANDTDRKNSSEDTKCEITTDEHQNEMQIKWEWEIKCFCKGKKSIKELSIEELSIEELSIEELEKQTWQCLKNVQTGRDWDFGLECEDSVQDFFHEVVKKTHHD